MNNWIGCLLLCLLFVGCSSDNDVDGKETYTGIPLVILDVDIPSSTDDLFALQMLYRYADEGKCKLLGVVVDRVGQAGAEVVDIMNTYYGYSLSNYNSIINKIICEESVNVNDRIWYNTKSVDLGDKACAYRVGEIRIESAQIYSATVVDSDGGAHQRINAVLPVVKLENNIKTTGKDANGVWQLKID